MQHANLADLGVYHSSEIPLVFGTYPRVNDTKEEIQLSRFMQHAWACFAKNPTAGPGWKLYPNIGVLGTFGKGLEVDLDGV
jgi:carboxylesterase type B